MECDLTGADVYLQFKKSTDSSWTTMSAVTTPLYTHEANPQYTEGDGVSQAVWTIHVGTGAGGFTWHVRAFAISTSYPSPTQSLVVASPAAAATPLRSLMGVGT